MLAHLESSRVYIKNAEGAVHYRNPVLKGYWMKYTSRTLSTWSKRSKISTKVLILALKINVRLDALIFPQCNESASPVHQSRCRWSQEDEDSGESIPHPSSSTGSSKSQSFTKITSSPHLRQACDYSRDQQNLSQFFMILRLFWSHYALF